MGFKMALGSAIEMTATTAAVMVAGLAIPFTTTAVGQGKPQQPRTGTAHPHKERAVRGFVTPYFSPQGGGAAALTTFRSRILA
ncbi:hypothetical protein WME79_27705 [Sorangium sp. So ce726]|uniref:hypothetical protein n=1 Tax=Sorangium sp. So ce726 TaxID=3133319 RepID=UPI003F5E6125